MTTQNRDSVDNAYDIVFNVYEFSSLLTRLSGARKKPVTKSETRDDNDKSNFRFVIETN